MLNVYQQHLHMGIASGLVPFPEATGPNPPEPPAPKIYAPVLVTLTNPQPAFGPKSK